MSRQNTIGKLNTTIRQEGADTVVRVYSTDVVRFNATHITVCNGGWITPFTAKRINQTAQQFGLNFGVNIAGGKRVRGSNNLLYKERNPSGARMTVTHGGITQDVPSDASVTFERASALPQSAVEASAQTDTE